MRRTILIAAIIAARGTGARADAIVEEISTGTQLSASTTPSINWIADRIAGIWDVSSWGQLGVDVGATGAMGASDEGGANTVFTTSASAEFTHDSHWSFSLTGGWSPASTTRSSATVQDDSLPGDFGEADARLAARSMMMS